MTATQNGKNSSDMFSEQQDSFAVASLKSHWGSVEGAKAQGGGTETLPPERIWTYARWQIDTNSRGDIKTYFGPLQ